MLTQTIYIAQNTNTIENIRTGTEPEPPFDDSSVEAVQAAWDNDVKMRCLGRRMYRSKTEVGPDVRVMFVNKDFYLFLQHPPIILNVKGIAIGERRSNLIPVNN